MEKVIIELKDVDVYYDKGKPIESHALKSLSFLVNEGEYVCLFGPSGCGKSSVLYAVSGIEIPTIGTVVVDDNNLKNLSHADLSSFRQNSIGIVFQNFNLLPTLDVIHNIALPLTFAGIPELERLSRAKKILDRLNISYLATRLPQELSGGQQQRVGIARAIINNPPVILADEPLGSLDSVNAENVLAFLKELHEKDKRTIVMVTHEAWSMRDADRVIYMRDGAITKIEKQGGSQEISEKAAYSAVYPEASPITIDSTIFADLLLQGGEHEDRGRLKLFVEDLLTKRISLVDFSSLLDQPWKDGGLGLWSAQVARIVSRARDLLSGDKIFEEIIKDVRVKDRDHLKQDLMELASWSARGLGKNTKIISEQNPARLGTILAGYLRDKYTTDQCIKTLNLPDAEGGLGIMITDAIQIAERIETLRREYHRLEFK